MGTHRAAGNRPLVDLEHSFSWLLLRLCAGERVNLVSTGLEKGEPSRAWEQDGDFVVQLSRNAGVVRELHCSTEL